MKQNMGTADRLLRLFAGLLLTRVRGPLRPPALALAGVMLGTSATGVCPAYKPLGIDTR